MTEETLFALALEKPAGHERRALLDAACGTDPRLRERVERLLAADERSCGILERSPVAPPAACEQDTLAHDQAAHTVPDAGVRRGIRQPDPPGYELIEEVGEGGMGVVYRARDTRLNRVVALKMVLGEAASPRAFIRFLAEAEAVAAIRHPHVVQVYEYGEADGRPFLALEYLPGGTLAGRLKASGQFPTREVAELLAKVADGVAAAHALGIVHRDLKPSNVLFDETGGPKVTDFGLARRSAGSDVTKTGAIMGTPPYMSPEQAGGKTRFVGPQSDVWSLGVILYECLAGVRPFAAESLEELLGKVMSAEFAPLRSRVRRLPKDLDTVVSRCLQKDPADRYPSARELADDLGRFVRGEPVAARPVGTAERFAKWVRRNPTRAAAWGVSGLAGALAAVVVLVVGLWREAESARLRVEDLLGTESRLRGDLQGANVKLEDALNGERTAREDEEWLRKEIVFLNYAHAVDLALREYGANNIARARELLASCPADVRGWEWDYVHRLCHHDLATFRGHHGPVKSASFSPDGKRVVTASSDRTARVWDAQTGRQLALLDGHIDGATSALFSADGKRILTSSHRAAWVWDAETGTQLALLKDHTAGVESASFSPNGKRVVTSSLDKTARVWDAETGREMAVLKGRTFWTASASFSPDGKRVVTASRDGIADLWDAETGREMVALKGHTGQIGVASFSADGKRVVTASQDGTARVWNADTGAELAVLKGHTNWVVSALFSPNGRRVVTASRDHTARLWDAEAGRELAVLKGHTAEVVSASFSADGKRVVTASQDGTARVWDTETRREPVLLRGHTLGVISASCSRDARRIVTAANDNTARMWDAITGKELVQFKGHTVFVRSVSFSADEERVVTGSGDQTARDWDAQTGRELTLLRGHTGVVVSASFSSDGRRVVTASLDDTARVWDADTGKELKTFKGHTDLIEWASFSSDGRRVVTASQDGTARVWDADTGRELAIIRGHTGKVSSASFSADGERVVTTSRDGTARVWDAHMGQGLALLKGHALGAHSASFSPDGRRVVTASADTTVRVWDADTGKLMLTFPCGTRGALFARFSDDGTRILTAGYEDSKTISVTIYDARPVNRAFIKPTPLDIPPRSAAPREVAPPPREK